MRQLIQCQRLWKSILESFEEFKVTYVRQEANETTDTMSREKEEMM